jgi:ATP-dependent Clp protease, protease subunit
MDTSTSELAYRNLMERRTLMLDVPIDDAAASSIAAQLLYVDEQGSGPVQLFVNSPGGALSATLAIVDTIEAVDAEVSTICTGQAAGSAVMVVAAGARGRRVAMPHSHFVLAPFKPERDYSVDELAEFVRFRKECYERFGQLTGHTAEEIEADCEKGRAFDAREALAYGIIDEVREKGKVVS